tara:strand:- start:4710 stop:5180 length:471 start_codon:yes stop_codon:yes gene_type:complete
MNNDSSNEVKIYSNQFKLIKTIIMNHYYNKNIPIEVILNVREYLSYMDSIYKIDKKNNKDFKKLENYAEKIQSWYRSKLQDTDFDNWTKKRIVNAFYNNYEWDYLKTYPTFLVKKCSRPDLLEYAQNAERHPSRKKIKDFLNLPSISKEEILFTGW